MSDMDTKTVTLSDEDIAVLDFYVESGEYASREDALRDAVSALKAYRKTDDLFEVLDDADTERWLREEVQPAYEAITNNPSIGLTSEQVRQHLDAHHKKRLAEQK